MHGFYFDKKMYKEGESPSYGDWPDILPFSLFVYNTKEEAIKALEEEEKKMEEAGKKAAQQYNNYIMRRMKGI